MKIFCDFHHADLFYSLQLLFEDRLGGELYRPIGLEWREQGFWNIYDHPATAKQFLGLDQSTNHPLDVHGNPLEESAIVNKHYHIENGIHYVKDPSHNNYIQRSITLEKFKELKFDIIISSVPQHIPMFNRLITLYQPQAKHIFQVGNAWGHQPGIKNILSSTAPFPVPSGINICFYHQEFNLNMYRYETPSIHNIINSYVHCMPQVQIMNQYKSLLPEFSITSYGASMDDCLHGAQAVANQMNKSAWTYHYKPGGDGYGHTIHSSYACGRPALIWGSQYRGKLADALFVHNHTCIDMEQNNPTINAELIRQWSQPEQHKIMCQNSYNKFKEIVDFDKEEQEIRKFLENLK